MIRNACPSHAARDTRVCVAWPAMVVLRDSEPSRREHETQRRLQIVAAEQRVLDDELCGDSG